MDHAILAAMRRDVTAYSVRAGVAGNWVFAVADLVAAGVLYGVHTSSSLRAQA